MEFLSRSDDAYVRASPTRGMINISTHFYVHDIIGVLGGIAEHTTDVISLCEAGCINIDSLFKISSI